VKVATNSATRRDFQNALLLGGTNVILDWEKLSAQIAQSPPPLGEQEYCERVLQIANGAELSIFQWNQLVGLSIVNVRSNSTAQSLLIPAPPDRVAWLRESLAAFIDGSEATKKAISASVASDLNTNRVFIIPSYSSKHGRRDRVIATGVNSALVYGLWLLFDANRVYAEKLRRCQYSGCPAFFFKNTETGGAPVRMYCSDEHAELGMREAARQRMQKLRKNRR